MKLFMTGFVCLGLLGAGDAFADEDVQALVIDNGSEETVDPASYCDDQTGAAKGLCMGFYVGLGCHLQEVPSNACDTLADKYYNRTGGDVWDLTKPGDMNDLECEYCQEPIGQEPDEDTEGGG